MSEIILSPTTCTVDHHGGLADTIEINQMLNTITPDWPEWSISPPPGLGPETVVGLIDVVDGKKTVDDCHVQPISTTPTSDVTNIVMDIKSSITKDMRRLESELVNTVNKLFLDESSRKVACLEEKLSSEKLINEILEATNKMLQEQLIITKTELENVTKCSVDSKQTTEAMEELQAMISDLRGELKCKKNQISLLESQNAKLCQDINCLQIRLSEKNEMIMKMDEKFHSMSNNYRVNLEKLNHVNREIHAEKTKEDYPNIKDIFRQSEKPPERAGNMKVQPSLDSSSEENVVYERATYTDTKKDQKDVSEVEKKTIFVIGNSHMNKLDPERLSRSYNVEKVVAYTIKEAKEAIQKISKEPDCVVFHLITNDVKNCDADECVKRMNNLVEVSLKKFRNCKIIVSLAPNRKDSVLYNNKNDVVNSNLKALYQDNEAVYCCNNNNLSNVFGKIKDRFIGKDGIHLSEDGCKMLYSNIKFAIDNLFNVKTNLRRYNVSRRPIHGSHSSNNHWHRSFGRTSSRHHNLHGPFHGRYPHHNYDRF